MFKNIKSAFEKFASQNRDQQELERRVLHFLELHSDCSETTVIASPEFGSSQYACVVTVPSVRLYVWAQKHVLGNASLGIEGQTSREFLYRWLARADFSNGRVSALPPPASGIVAPYLRQFVEDGVAVVFCPDCKRTVQNIQIRESDSHTESAYTVWREIWLCPCGHVLHRKTHKARLIRTWSSGR